MYTLFKINYTVYWGMDIIELVLFLQNMNKQ